MENTYTEEEVIRLGQWSPPPNIAVSASKERKKAHALQSTKQLQYLFLFIYFKVN